MTTLRDLAAQHFGDAFMAPGHAAAHPGCETCRNATRDAIAALAADPETVEVLARALRATDRVLLAAEGRPSDYQRWATALLRELTGEPHE